ncbi:MAG TPA: pyridoxal phosphate-dependent aminotransferase [Acetobacteraceae bacterium]|jgi:arginine:pyruvate transaminase
MRLAERVNRIGGDGANAWSIHFAALAQVEAGRDVIVLTVGDPDQAPPELVIEETVRALRAHRTGYAPITGYPNVRAAIAARVARRTGQPCTADNVVVVAGAQAGVYCAVQCLAGPGDEVIVPEPVYATYAGVIAASGARMVNVPLRPENGFHPDVAALADAITPRTRAIWINTPHNPTGSVLSHSEVAAIAELCRRHDLWLLSDEVYEDLTYERPHVSPWSLPGMAERTIVVSSLSKSHAMPGFRLGWIVAPSILKQPLFDLLVCMLYGGPPFIQDGALAALRQELPEVAAMRETYRSRAALLTDILANAPRCHVTRPEGGMFVLLDVRGTQRSSRDFATALLEHEAVAVLPCDGFGPSAVGQLRISLTVPGVRLKEAGMRIVRFAEGLTG